MPTPSSPRPRIASLDQFRGYTVAGMLLVNFVGGHRGIPAVLQHHNTYCSYADTIMPQFFFAVGYAYRLTFLRRWQSQGAGAAIGHTVKRCLGLCLLGFVIYHLDGGARSWAELEKLGLAGFLTTAFQRTFFQTLVHIAVASLWVLPAIGASAAVRLGYLAGSAVLHVVLSNAFYYHWVMTRPGIDGGPLGFLTWSIPLLVGSLAYDMMSAAPNVRRPPVARMLAAGALFMLIGYALACLNGSGAPDSARLAFRLVEPPFVPPSQPVDLWTMSQRAGSVSYQTFGAGFSLALFALFALSCDAASWQLPLFRTFGTNALAAYVIHELVAGAVKPFCPKDAPLACTLLGFAIYFAITYTFVRYLEKNEIFIKL
jgi:predicted acyltransferase